MESIMQVRDLTKSFGDVKAVRGISFDIPAGSCFGLLGPNGAGKTTTIEMMEGIQKPDGGEILFRGETIDQKFRQKVGIQFQHTALPEFITVRETLELFSSFYPSPRVMDEVIELCSLEDIIRRDNRKLSGGQRQRMLLALAIIPRPEIVFLDEPTTGLDPQARRNFWELIRGIQSEGTTVLLTTHYMDEAQVLCDRIAIMDHGKILELDTPEQLLRRHFDGAVIHIPWTDEFTRDDARRVPDAVGSNVTEAGLEIVTERLDMSIRALMDSGVALDGINIHKPNLEDLFIKLTGSSLRS
jgi:ABC-2 type transport system ATP-binding protein